MSWLFLSATGSAVFVIVSVALVFAKARAERRIAGPEDEELLKMLDQRAKRLNSRLRKGPKADEILHAARRAKRADADAARQVAIRMEATPVELSSKDRDKQDGHVAPFKRRRG